MRYLIRNYWVCFGKIIILLQNRQGPDVGNQYRSAIFYHDEQQKEIAEKSKEFLDSSKAFDDPIVTQIVPAPEFYKAEDYHQKYFKKQGF